MPVIILAKLQIKKFLRFCAIVFAVVLALLMVGCSSNAPQPTTTTNANYSADANDVLFSALSLVGTPYRYGGNTPESGFDCSGLIDYVYRESVDVRLPRTVAEINKLDVPTIAEDELQSGDLVIFATGFGSRPSHAGIYVGEGRFVHAPSSGGTVRMDLLSDKYWQRSYLNAKRPLASN
jgi:cell wall-associated NlpC family hydrolase